MQIEKTAKSINEAIDLALNELNTTIDKIDYEVIQHPSKSLFGLFSRPAKVLVKLKSTSTSSVISSTSTKKIPKFVDSDDFEKNNKPFNPNIQSIAHSFLSEIFEKMNIDVSPSLTSSNKNTLFFDLVGKDVGVIIGKRGQTLDSLQHLTNLAINKGNFAFTSVVLDAENYRERRKKTLESLAFNISKKVIKSKKSFNLEPMSPYERRIIHSRLQNEKNIKTYSEGKEPFRYVVISPK